MRISKIITMTIVCFFVFLFIFIVGVKFSWRFQKSAILIVDVADYGIGGKEKILDWFEHNDELKNEFDFRAIITTNADFSSFNPFRFYDEIEAMLGAKNLIHATMPDLTLGLYFSSVFFKNKDIFSDKTEKNLIIISGRANQSQEIKNFQLNNPNIKIIIATLNSEKQKTYPFKIKRKSKNVAKGGLIPSFFIYLTW
ncbi:MAG: hypothetical protein AAB405_02110 [Patescibacteria group bacterium]